MWDYSFTTVQQTPSGLNVPKVEFLRPFRDQDRFLIEAIDVSQIGVHEVTVIIEAYYPNDPDKGSQRLEFTFTVTIMPCIVESLYSDKRIESLIVPLGSDSVTTGMYSFIERPWCGYDQVIEIVPELPPFIVHNEQQRTFTVLPDIAVSGIYEESPLLLIMHDKRR